MTLTWAIFWKPLTFDKRKVLEFIQSQGNYVGLVSTTVTVLSLTIIHKREVSIFCCDEVREMLGDQSEHGKVLYVSGCRHREFKGS